MTHLKTLIIATAAILSVAGNASAGEPTYQAVFTFDKNAVVSEQYISFETEAKAVCKEEIRRAGYRATQSTSWEQRKCVRELVAQAVKATKSKALISFHKSTGPTIPTRKYANK